MNQDVIELLMNSEEPSVRYRVKTEILEINSESNEMVAVREEIRSCDRVKKLLSERDEEGKIPYHPYDKWYGAHWILSLLADLKYPPGDKSLIPLREQVLGWLLSDRHKKYIKTINGRIRRCASQEGNAIYSLCALGIADDRVDELVKRLINWQWDDGGWNCDKKPDAKNSSFMETLLPFRGLALFAIMNHNNEAAEKAKRASEVFLKRHLFKKQKDGSIIRNEFIKLHYPCYWHYDILFGLKVLSEAGFINDDRCKDALDLLETKELASGGFPAENKYYRVTDKFTSGRSLVKWGITGKTKMNEFTTLDALYVLKKSGRLNINVAKA